MKKLLIAFVICFALAPILVACGTDNGNNEHTHNWGTWGDSTATITQDGIETRVCLDDSTHSETRISYATGTPGLFFSERWDALNFIGYAVSKGTADTSGTVYIPKYYNREPVIEISIDAFVDSTDLESVVVPASITTIRQGAFAGCSNLASVVFEQDSQLETIIGTAFFRCGFENFTIPDGVKNLGTTAIAARQFDECANLKTIVIPKSVLNIGSEIFWQSPNLEKVFYGGDESDWNSIIIQGGFPSVKLPDGAVLYFYSTSEPTTPGNFWYYNNDNVPTVW